MDPVQETPSHPALRITTEIAPWGYKIPKTVAEIMSTGGSLAGYSAVSNFLSCPERSRLQSLGIRPKPKQREAGPGIDEIEDPRTWGSIIHALRATRLAYGQPTALQLIDTLDLNQLDRMKLLNIWLIYDQQFPLELEPFKYLGVEIEVVTDIALPGEAPCLRSVRYDSVIVADDAYGTPALFSFECKSSSRSGESQFGQYTPQFMSQTALWNANPALVAKYGTMSGVVIDAVIKTQVPKCERIGPKYISKHMQQRALEYLRIAESVVFQRGPDGAYPRMLHTCWGRYRPCEFIGACHEGAWGDYEQHDRKTGEVVSLYA